jgi:hypothetical protein
LLEIDLKILLRKTGTRLNCKLALISMHIDPDPTKERNSKVGPDVGNERKKDKLGRSKITNYICITLLFMCTNKQRSAGQGESL